MPSLDFLTRVCQAERDSVIDKKSYETLVLFKQDTRIGNDSLIWHLILF